MSSSKIEAGGLLKKLQDGVLFGRSIIIVLNVKSAGKYEEILGCIADNSLCIPSNSTIVKDVIFVEDLSDFSLRDISLIIT